MDPKSSESKTILVCGGAGYIGSHMCKALARAGHEPVVFDNLSTGHRWAVKWGALLEGDLLDPDALARAFSGYRFDAVMHFAGRSVVAESMKDPGLYFRNNTTGTLNLLDAMRSAGVAKLIFSSSAAVYGDPLYCPIDEAHPTRPISPYGWSKLMAETQISEYCRGHGLRAVCLRYFNAAGADPEGEVGEVHEPETHLIPNIIRAALDPDPSPVRIFGNDYETPDGTCIRDYIHVSDLCAAHLNALDYLDLEAGCHVFNLGTGTGYSAAEVLNSCRKLCDDRPMAEVGPRRTGDPPVLVADGRKAARILKLRAQRDLATILQTAKSWHGRPS